MNRQSCFNLVCRGPFVSCANIGTFLVLTKQKAGWVREIDHIHYRKRKLVTLRLRCESVSNSLNISRTKKKMSWQPQLWELCDNLRMLKWWYDLSDAAKAAVIGGRFWRWTLRRYFVTKFKQFNLFSKSRYNVSQHHWEAVSNNHRICCQVWLHYEPQRSGS